MYQKRLKGYSAIGYKLRMETNAEFSDDIIYDGKSFMSVYAKDIRNARKEVLVVSPYMRKNRIKNLIPLLREAIENGVSATVITRPADEHSEKSKTETDENIELLESAGVEVKTRSSYHQKFTVIDAKTVWFGSVNFLSFGTADESLMRFESYDIAGELTDTVM